MIQVKETNFQMTKPKVLTIHGLGSVINNLALDYGKLAIEG